MSIRNHLHPGKIIKNIFGRAGLSIGEAACALGVTRLSVSKLFNCHVGISPEMAVRLAIAFNTTTERWLNLQASYDAWLIEKQKKKIAKQVTPLKLKNRTAKTRAA